MAVFLVGKKKVREAKIITRTMKGMTIVGFFFFFFFLELFHMSVFSFFKTLLKKLELKFKVISQCKLLNLTLVLVVKKAGTRASEKKGVPILE